jgi:ubiquinone/menaquinone biosynthesis C-methylase UbiE
MAKERIIETTEGIQEEFDVEQYNIMARYLRDKGYMETDSIIKSGIDKGEALEIGPGPGYLGLEWLKKTKGTALSCLEISPAMIAMAKKNAKEYGLSDQVKYTSGTSLSMPFKDNTFDAVFSNGSLHEWEKPVNVFNEIYRVLKAGGRFFISDLRRDMNIIIKWFLKANCKPKEMIKGLISSINAAYLKKELKAILGETKIKNYKIKPSPFGFEILGKK